MAPTTPAKNGNGNGLLSKFLAGGLLLFLAWLGYSVIQIEKAIVAIDTKVDSLLETRRDQTRDQRQNAGARLKELEDVQ